MLRLAHAVLAAVGCGRLGLLLGVPGGLGRAGLARRRREAQSSNGHNEEDHHSPAHPPDRSPMAVKPIARTSPSVGRWGPGLGILVYHQDPPSVECNN